MSETLLKFKEFIKEMRVLISLLSDYLQPNFLLIKEFEGKFDKLVFVSTKDMEDKNKSNLLERALNLPKSSVERIVVVEDDFEKIKRRLEEADFSTSNDYILNLTGGTKVMPLAVYEFFKEKYNSHFYYVPIGKNIVKDLNSENEMSLDYRMNLEEYFTLNGIWYECDNTLTYGQAHPMELFEKIKKVRFNRYCIPKMRNYQDLSDAKDKRYYGGAWFEEYCYLRLKQEQGLKSGEICKGAKIFREKSEQNDNEIDVMFIKENQLYVFECKVSVSGLEGPKETIEKYQYKLAAISKDYGLRVNSYLLTLHNVFDNYNISTQVKNNILKRQRILGLKGVFDSSVFMQETLPLGDVKKKIESIAEKVVPPQQPVVEKIEIPRLSGLKIVGKVDLDKLRRK